MWTELKTKADAVADRAILDLFDDARADEFAVQTQHMRFDYSKTNLDTDTRALLLALAGSANVAARRDALFAGEKINEPEGRVGDAGADGRLCRRGARECHHRCGEYRDWRIGPWARDGGAGAVALP